MIITRTPYRLPLFGEGSDQPSWNQYGEGLTLSACIDKYCYITCRNLPNFFEHKHRVVYSKIETAKTTDDIQHPAVRKIFQYLNVQNGLEVHYDGDLPAHSGIGSNTSFVVGLLNTLMALNGASKSKAELAEIAMSIESFHLKESSGRQDPIVTSYGGINRLQFAQDGTYQLTPLLIPKARENTFSHQLLLYFIGFSKNKLQPIACNSSEKTLDYTRRHVALARKAGQILEDSDKCLDDIGLLLHEVWELRKKLLEIPYPENCLQFMAKALNAGALGGFPLLNTGGGFALVYAPKAAQEKVQAALSSYTPVKYNFEHRGTHLVLNDNRSRNLFS